MKKIFVVSTIAISALILSNCSSSKKASSSAVNSTFENNVSAVIMSHCSPCHIPAKGGNKKPLDNFAGVKESIDEIIRRVELNPGERGFMPMKRAKLNDSTIAVFTQWKKDGLLEK